LETDVHVFPQFNVIESYARDSNQPQQTAAGT
jgi:hypothetical protein